MDLTEVGELAFVVLAICRCSHGNSQRLTEGVFVSKRHIDEAVVSERRHGSNGGGFLTASLSAGGDEKPGELLSIRSLGPLLASLVPEGLPLGGEVSVSSGNSKQDSVVFLEHSRVGENLDVGGLGGSVHLSEDVLGKSLCNPELW